MAKLGDVCTFYSGTGFPNVYQGKADGKYPFYKVGDISRNVLSGNRELKICENYIDDDTVTKIKGTLLPPQTVVFAKIGEALRLNRRAMTSCDCLVDNNAMGIKSDASIIDSLYFYFFMCNVDLQKYCESTTVPSVRKTRIAEIEIPLPPLDEQRRIATVLDKVSDLIAKRREQLRKLDELVKARFVEMFGDPETNPKGWQRQRLDEICENLDNRRVPITSTNRKAGMYPYYGASGIVDYVDDYIFDEDILLISEDGANLVMRSTPIAFSVSGKVWVNNHAHVVRFDSQATQKYIEICFSLTDISGYITGTAQPKLNQAKLNAMMFCIPPLAMQKQFANFVAQTDKSKLTIQQSLDKLEVLKKALMQQYFG